MNPGLIDWHISIGTLIHLAVSVGVLGFTIVKAYFGLRALIDQNLQRLTAVETKIDSQNGRINRLYDYWERHLERRQRAE